MRHQGVDETTSLVWYLSKQIWKTKSTAQDSLPSLLGYRLLHQQKNSFHHFPSTFLLSFICNLVLDLFFVLFRRIVFTSTSKSERNHSFGTDMHINHGVVFSL